MKYETYQDAKSEWRWTLVANNGEPIADSAEGYKNEADCMHGIALVKGSQSAPIVRVVREPSLADHLRNALAPRNALLDVQNKRR